MRVAKTELKQVNEQSAIEDHKYLIRYASKFFSHKINPVRMDYWDLYGEGVLLLTICLSKWKDKDKNNRAGFSRYFKTTLFRRFNQLRYWIAKKDYEIPTDSIDDALSLKVESDGGFGEVNFKELCYHVASGLRQPDKAIFSLLVDPPENLMKVVLKESRKREKRMNNSDVRLRSRHVVQYLNLNGCPLTIAEYSHSIKRIRSRVKQVVLV